MLSDDEKKRKYDKYGHDGPKFSGFGGGGFGFHFHQPDDIFKNFFSTNGFDNREDTDFFSSFFNNNSFFENRNENIFTSHMGRSNLGSRGFGSVFEDELFSSDHMTGRKKSKRKNRID